MIIHWKKYRAHILLKSLWRSFWGQLRLVNAQEQTLARVRLGLRPNLFSNSRRKGAPKLLQDSEGNLRCTSCLLCQEICPTQCIDITPGSKPLSTPKSFKLAIMECVYCGLCETICPYHAIDLSGPSHVALLAKQDQLVWELKER